MIVVKVELHSAITRKVTLGEVCIANVGGGGRDSRKGDYKAVAVKKGRKSPLGVSVSVGSPDVIRSTEVHNYARLSRPVWDLVTLALQGMGYGDKR